MGHIRISKKCKFEFNVVDHVLEDDHAALNSMELNSVKPIDSNLINRLNDRQIV